MSSYTTYNNNALTESDVNYEAQKATAEGSIMDIDDYNNELARRAKKPLDKNLETFIPYCKTFEVYAAKKIPYSMPEGDKRVTNFVIESGESYARKVTRIYKIKSPANDNKLFIKWNEIRYGKTGIGNAREVTADNVGEYMDPIPDYTIAFDQRTEAQQVKIKGTKGVITRYNLEYSDKLVAELLKDAEGQNPETVEFVLKVDSKPEDMIVSYAEFINADFDTIYNYHRNLITARKTGMAAPSAPPNLGLSGNNSKQTTTKQ